MSLPQTTAFTQPQLYCQNVKAADGRVCGFAADRIAGGVPRCQLHSFEYELADVSERYISGEWPIDSLPASAAKRILAERTARLTQEVA